MFEYEYIIAILSIIALALVVKIAIMQSQKKISDSNAWSDLNTMLEDLYQNNDTLKQDLHLSAQKLKLTGAVQDTLKLSVETMFHANAELITNLENTVKACSKLERVCDALQHELHYHKNPEETVSFPDDLNDWIEIDSSQLELFKHDSTKN